MNLNWITAKEKLLELTVFGNDYILLYLNFSHSLKLQIFQGTLKLNWKTETLLQIDFGNEEVRHLNLFISIHLNVILRKNQNEVDA